MTFNTTTGMLLSISNMDEVPYGTLDLMVLKTLDGMGPLHGYGIARRIDDIEVRRLLAPENVRVP